jgi:HK97 family phage prohead protease
MAPDFTGYATKSGIRCSDGRVIAPGAFQHMDGQQVPLVWQHQTNSPTNVLGYALLHARADGVYAEGFFNDTPDGENAKKLVKHGDIKNLSIYANQLIEQAKNVTHGIIREVSLVLAGANPGAFIDNVNLAHADGSTGILADEAVLYNADDEIIHAGSTTVEPPKKVVMSKGAMPKAADTPAASDADAADDSTTVQDVIDTMTPVQQKVMYGLVGAAMKQSDPDDPNSTITHQEGDDAVTRNVFDQSNTATGERKKTLTHAQEVEILDSWKKDGGSLKAAVERWQGSNSLQHGIDDIDVLFPYDQAVTDTPEFIARRMDWVAGVLGGVRRTPFARIRSWTANLTLDEARAKGYVTGAMKKEEFIDMARRITTPTTIYKKQKLDRDDIADITSFDVVTWLQTEMRLMLDEEVARAILVGDGRDVDDEDKVNGSNVRPIVGDDELYVTTLQVDLNDTGSSADEIIDAVVTGMRYYRGSGNPTFFTTLPYLSKMLLAKDTLGRRLYQDTAALATAMGVANIVPVEAMEASSGVIGVIVNLTDYTVGADQLGQVSMFDFFDIDYNQFKYLMETRISGAMTKYKGALVIEEFTGAGGILAYPTAPTFVSSTGVVTIPTTAHVTYVVVDDTDGTEGSALTAGAQTAIGAGTSVHIRAKAASTYSFIDNANNDWTFVADPAS